MSNTNTGGPAFPQDLQGRRGDDPFLQGMTLRDYFAAKAMQGLLADPTIDPTFKADHKQFAYAAYEIADAMLKARES